MITGMTRGHVDLDIDGRTIRLQGEGYHHGPVLFDVYLSAHLRWNDGTEVTDDDREIIIADLKSSGLAIEIIGGP